MSRGAVVVGAHINGLGVIRSLGPRGVPIASVSTRSFDIAQHSRWVSERHALPALHENGDALVDLLERNARRWPGWAVFPTNDDALTALARNHDRLAPTYCLPLQPWEVISHLVDKDRMLALADRAGLASPPCYGEATRETAARSGLRYPVVVKPIQHDRLISRYGAKLFLARDAGELQRATARLQAAGSPGLVFEFIPGPDSEIYVYCVYVDARGEPSPGLTVRKLRQNPPFIGGARAAEVVDEIPELREATVELLRRAGFRGMAFAEFKRDRRDGRFFFIEVNARAVLFNSIAPVAGVDLVGMTWEDFVLDETPRASATGWRGVWVHLQAELRCWLSYRHEERLGFAERWSPYLRAKVHAVWSASDPRPFVEQTRLALVGRRESGDGR